MESARIAQFQHIWKLFAQTTRRPDEHPMSMALPPPWLVEFCHEAQLSPDGPAGDTAAGDMDFQAIEAFIQQSKPSHRSPLAEASRSLSEKVPPVDTEADHSPDPYLSINIRIFREEDYVYGPYAYPAPTALPEDLQNKLSNDQPHTKYLWIGEAYAFPERMQLPTSWGTEPARLLIDPTDTQPTVYVQLSAYFPPLAWIPLKPSVRALRRVLTEFAHLASAHHASHHQKFVKRWEEAKHCLVKQKILPSAAIDAYDENSANTDSLSSQVTSAVLRYVGWMARAAPFHEAPVREFPNSQEFFCGEYEYTEKFLSYLEACPFLFAVPELRTDTTEFWGKADGPGVAMCVFRCIYSKAVIWVKVHFSTEVKLPPTDPALFKKIWSEKDEHPPTYTPVFIRAVWPDNVKMSGGGGLIRRFNQCLGTEFAQDMPIDAAMALVYATAWAGRRDDLLGVQKMRQRLQQWEAKVLSGKQAVRREFGAYPGTAELPSPLYSDKERLGMHLQYAAHLGDPDISQTIRKWMGYDSGAVRLGCAKAALEAGNKALFFEVVQKEVPGRFRKAMLRCYRTRSKRDVYDKVPRLHDEQFETLESGDLPPISLDGLSPDALESSVRMHVDRQEMKDL